MGLSKERAIRVFVSSTFQDMQEERDELVKYVFPKLRALCESRRVTWSEVDLRWGITDEEKSEGKVLPICLEEIRNCRPYFIGIIGERYGWIPESIPEDLIEVESWLNEYNNRSVTELEILHGVLRNPEMAEHAFFYFRDPAYVESLPDNDRSNFVCETDDQASKLRSLKQEIRNSGFPVRENYKNPRAISSIVLNDMTEVIDRLFPEDEIPDPFVHEASDHEHYARRKSQIYIGRPEYYDALDNHIEGTDQPLVVLGESGSGKSALLASWALRFKERNPKTTMVMHFTGASHSSTDWASLVRRIMDALKRRFRFKEDIPEDLTKLRIAFANFLFMASKRGRVVLVLDALNQLEDKEGALDLLWVPREIPKNIRIVLSTLPGRVLDEAAKRSWKSLKLAPLAEDERRTLINTYLKQYSKKIDDELLNRIASVPQASNPLFLRILLEELRLCGDHALIRQHINDYLTAQTIESLYQMILERYEKDYDRERPKLVKDSLSLVWASRKGLTEAELLSLLGSQDQAMPQAYWSPLHLALGESLFSRAGLMNFAHSYFRDAVKKRYLESEELQTAAHMKLSEYFKGLNLNERKLDEYAWQLQRSGDILSLRKFLWNRTVLRIFWKTRKYEFLSYYSAIEHKHPNHLSVNIRSVLKKLEDIQNPEHKDFARFFGDELDEGTNNYFWCLSELCEYKERHAFSILLMKHIALYYQQYGYTIEEYIEALLRLVDLLLTADHQDLAMKIFIEIENVIIINFYLGSLLLYSYEKSGGDLFKIAEKIFFYVLRAFMSIAPNPFQLLNILEKRGIIYSKQGKTKEALTCFTKAEWYFKTYYNFGLRPSVWVLKTFPRLSKFFIGILFFLLGWKDEDVTEFYNDGRFIMEKEIMKAILEPLHNKALVYQARKEFGKAQKILKREETYAERYNNKIYLYRILLMQADILTAKGELDDAIGAYEKCKKLCRELGDTEHEQEALGKLAMIYAKRDVTQAKKYIKEQESLCRALGRRDLLANCLVSELTLAEDGGDSGSMSIIRREIETLSSSVQGEEDILLKEESFQFGYEDLIKSIFISHKEVLESENAQPDEAVLDKLARDEERSLRRARKKVFIRRKVILAFA